MTKPHRKIKSSKPELRSTLQGSRLEVREQNGQKKLSGYAVVFNSPADIGGDFTEIVAPGAFTRTLKEDDQVMLRDHLSQLLLGRRSAGTLSLRQDNTGLAFEVSPLPNTTLGNDTYEDVRIGNLKGCSFGFFVRDDTWTQDADGKLTRVLKDIQLQEVTLTAFPAYDSTSVDVRSIRAKRLTKSELKRNDDGCDCDCPECIDNDCANCSDPECDDPNCEGGDDEECSCPCPECVRGACEACTNSECDDDNCLLCPTAERAAHMDMILRRFRT
jgi:HK97 family phage prohead protease